MSLDEPRSHPTDTNDPTRTAWELAGFPWVPGRSLPWETGAAVHRDDAPDRRAQPGGAAAGQRRPAVRAPAPT